jgi:hypothetical protein
MFLNDSSKSKNYSRSRVTPKASTMSYIVQLPKAFVNLKTQSCNLSVNDMFTSHRSGFKTFGLAELCLL